MSDFNFSMGDVKDQFKDLPAGSVLLQIKDYELKKTKTDKAMLVLTFLGVEPSDVAGIEKKEFCVLGESANPARDIKEDPMALLPETWKRRLSQLKKLTEAAGWDQTKDLGFREQDGYKAPFALLEFLKGKVVGAGVTQEHEPMVDRNGQPNQYAGRVRSRFSNWLKKGSFTPKVSETQLQPTDHTGGGATSGTLSMPATAVGAAPPAE